MWRWKRRPRADITEIAADADRRLEAARREEQQARTHAAQVARLKRASDRLAEQNQIARLIRDGF